MLCTLCAEILPVFGVQTYPEAGRVPQRVEAVIMFWNMENYYDPFDDPEIADEEFTPYGEKHWTWKKFKRKRNGIAKTIMAVGDKCGNYPAIIGVCEVENRMVLNQLVNETPLARLNYGIIHRDSPDLRGIDVGLLYRKDLFVPLSVKSILVDLESERKTRDILYVKGVLRIKDVMLPTDTLHLFVNHWPSKLGGEQQSFPARMTAANVLRFAVDSITGRMSDKAIPPLIVIMGDFNDVASGVPLQYAVADKDSLRVTLKVMSDTAEDRPKGSIKFRGEWEQIDHYIVSEAVFDRARMFIFAPDFLMEEDKTYLGKKPFRTYIGPQYHGGVSDHLPIVLLLH